MEQARIGQQLLEFQQRDLPKKPAVDPRRRGGSHRQRGQPFHPRGWRAERERRIFPRSFFRCRHGQRSYLRPNLGAKAAASPARGDPAHFGPRSYPDDRQPGHHHAGGPGVRRAHRPDRRRDGNSRRQPLPSAGGDQGQEPVGVAEAHPEVQAPAQRRIYGHRISQLCRGPPRSERGCDARLPRSLRPRRERGADDRRPASGQFQSPTTRRGSAGASA